MPQPLCPGNFVRSLCQEHLGQALKEKAAYWKQRSKQKALQEGDSNTSFFHAHATQRLRNAIKVVEVDGVRVTLLLHMMGKWQL